MAYESLGAILAEITKDLNPEERPARCPKCGGRLLVHATVYCYTDVRLRVGATYARAVHGRKIIETKKELDEQVTSNYDQIDEREEIHCENEIAGRCDYWTYPTALEMERR